jgi:acetyl esterase/lipase
MNITAIAFLTSIVFTASASSCNKGKNRNNVTDSIATELNMKNVKYGSDPMQVMDIFLPAGRSSDETKTIVLIHGGSWSGGDKSDFDATIAALKPQLPDYAFINVNYRLVRNNTNKFPTQLEDIDAALKFLKTKSGEYQINAAKVGLIGASAGAHLALLQAYKNNSENDIKAVVDLFGPTDLSYLYYHHPVPAALQPALANLLSATPATNPDAFQKASPLNYITPSSVPTLIFHGSADYIVPLFESNNLNAKLKANDVKVEMNVYKGEGHGWYGANLLDTYKKTIRFIKENVN